MSFISRKTAAIGRESAMDVAATEFTWYGRWVLLLGFAANMLNTGVAKSLGVLLPTLRDQFTAHTWLIGLVSSFYCASSVLTGEIAGTVCT